MAEQKAGGWATPYKYTGKELDEEIGMYDYGARFYDPSISLWTSVDPLTADMPDHGAYNYTFQNPIMYNDPTGMKGEGVDDYIFNIVQDDGSVKEVGRVKADGEDVIFNIDNETARKNGIQNVDFGEVDAKGKIDFNTQAFSLNLSAEAAYKGGGQLGISFIGMTKGPDKGEWGITVEVNGLAGLEAGVTASLSLYQPAAGKNLALEDLSGFEYGLSADALYQAVSFFEGLKDFSLQRPFGVQAYTGFSYGFSYGAPQIPVGLSGYAGYSFMIDDSKTIKKKMRGITP